MNEFIIFILILLGIIALIMFLQFINSKRDDKLYLLRLKNEFGKVNRSSYDRDRLVFADAYHKRHKNTDSLDDITWSDLSMDEIIACIDTTESEEGRQVLYHMLRTPLSVPDKVYSRRRIIDFFRDNEDIRSNILIALHHIGRMKKTSVYDMIEGMEDIKKDKTVI